MNNNAPPIDIKRLNVLPFLIATGAISIIFALVAIGLLIAMLLKTAKDSVNVNVLNTQTMEYQAAVNFRGIIPSIYNYTYFSVTPVLQLLPLIILYYIYRRKTRQDPNFEIELSPVQYVVLLVLLIHGVLCTLLNNMLVWGSPAKPIVSVSNRISDFNHTIHSFMYKGVVVATPADPNEEPKQTSPDALGLGSKMTDTTCITTPGSAIAFYCPLRTLVPDKASQYDQIRKALQTLPADINKEDLAKALFTVSLYLHFNKLGVRNDFTPAAISLFSPIKLLVTPLFTPADYLFSSSTFIDSKSFEFALSPNSTYLPEKIMQNKDLIIQASILNEKFITVANNKANNLFVKDAKKPFIILGFSIVIVQLIIPVILAFIIFQVIKHNLLTRFLTWMREHGNVLFGK